MKPNCTNIRLGKTKCVDQIIEHWVIEIETDCHRSNPPSCIDIQVGFSRKKCLYSFERRERKGVPCEYCEATLPDRSPAQYYLKVEDA